MKHELETKVLDYEKYLNRDVKIFNKDKKKDPITGRIIVVKKKFIVVLAKKAIRQENKFVYKKKSVKKEKIDRMNFI